MKAFTVLLLFFLTPLPQKPLPSPALETLLTSKYDKFMDQTTVAIKKPIILGDNAMVSPSFSYKGTSLTYPNAIRVFFIAPTRVWGSTPTRDTVLVLLDSRQPALQVGVAYSSTFNTDGIVSTSYTTGIPLIQFQQIACAKKVEMRIGLVEGEISASDMKGIRALYVEAGGICPSRSTSN